MGGADPFASIFTAADESLLSVIGVRA